MFLLVSVRHVGAHPVGHQHGMSIQLSINLGKTFLRISRIQNIPLTWILASNLVYLPPFRHFPDSWLYLLNGFDFYFMIYFECRDTENQPFGIVWIAIARGGTSRSHTLKILPARLAERDWCTKFQSSLQKFTPFSVSSRPLSYSFTFATCRILHCAKVWHKIIRYVTLHSVDRSCFSTEAQSSMIFVAAKKLYGIVWTKPLFLLRWCYTRRFATTIFSAT